MVQNKEKTNNNSKSSYGWVPDIPDSRDFKYFASGPLLQKLPPKVDLRPKCPTHIYNQGELGSCTANAIGAAIEFDLLKQGLTDFMPSRLFIYYNERDMENTVNSDSGAMIRDGIKSVNDKGVCKEDIWPYDISQFTKKPSEEAYKEALDNVVLDYSRVPRDLLQMKSVLAQGFPFVIGFTVYTYFETEDMMENGILKMPDLTTETVLGGHAVLVVGYDDSTSRFIVRNSWGDQWGECLTGQTMIPLLNGMEKSMEELVKEGKNVWIYSYDTKEQQIVPALAIPRFTGYRNDMVNVMLDNNERITCTGDHLFMLRNGDYRPAKDLKQGQSLMPLYRRIHKEYEEVYNLSSRSGNYIPTHKIIGNDIMNENILLEHSIKCKDHSKCDIIIHHIDRNKYNNEPTNLLKTFRCQHYDEHLDEMVKTGSKVLNELWNTNKEKMRLNSLKQINEYNEGLKTGKYILTEKQIETRRENCRKVGLSNKKNNNHKVLSVQKLDNGLNIPVYDLTVPRENCHNFAISSGVFVHNSGYFEMPYEYLLTDSLSDDFWRIRTIK